MKEILIALVLGIILAVLILNYASSETNSKALYEEVSNTTIVI
jgi:hypothetical protein